MYKHILIPTDGSDLSNKAVEQGVLFAKEIDAKITAMTVTEPFHLLPAALSQLEYTPIEYQKFTRAYAEEVLGIVSAAAKSARVKLRSDRHGFARASRRLGGCPRQRDGQGAHPLRRSPSLSTAKAEGPRGGGTEIQCSFVLAICLWSGDRRVLVGFSLDDRVAHNSRRFRLTTGSPFRCWLGLDRSRCLD